jgi:single-strand DNA-binding protein
MVFWRENAERLAQMGHKGNELLIEGKLKMRSWVDQQGQRKRVLEVMGDFFRMLSKREAVEAHESLDPDDDFGIFAGD